MSEPVLDEQVDAAAEFLANSAEEERQIVPEVEVILKKNKLVEFRFLYENLCLRFQFLPLLWPSLKQTRSPSGRKSNQSESPKRVNLLFLK